MLTYISNLAWLVSTRRLKQLADFLFPKLLHIDGPNFRAASAPSLCRVDMEERGSGVLRGLGRLLPDFIIINKIEGKSGRGSPSATCSSRTRQSSRPTEPEVWPLLLLTS